ncbi:MAG: response regulator [Limisphaerales bacterium]
MRPHILIADDEAPVRYLLSDLFRRRGYLATAVKSAPEAWHALDSTPIQLVILDIALDEADGLALLGELRQSHPRLPVLMLTGMGYDDELENEKGSNHSLAPMVGVLSETADYIQG